MRFLLSLHVSVPWRTPSMGCKTVSAVDHWISGWRLPADTLTCPSICSDFTHWLCGQFDAILTPLGAPKLQPLRCLYEPEGPMEGIPYLRVHLDLTQYGYLNPTPTGYSAAQSIAKSLGERLMNTPNLSPWIGAFMYRTPSFCGASVLSAAQHLHAQMESEEIFLALLSTCQPQGHSSMEIFSPLQTPTSLESITDEHYSRTRGRI